ncbi:MAG: hypothetical protein BroJett025_00630 [Patescibacteria group bacterium]|nr:MAG: hypothetical protein BroJett025_00630 [Patescibacteria group bacterium]
MSLRRSLGVTERVSSEKKPSPRAPISEFIWNIVSELQGFEPLSEQSLHNLTLANETLKKEALIVYLNHTSTKDAPVAISLVLSHLTNAIRFLGPAGMKHYDFSRDPINAILLRALRLLNIRAVPVIQHDDLESYPPHLRETLIKQLKKKTRGLLNRSRSVYGITPEGKRNKETGTILRARPGIGKLEKVAPRNIKYLPIAIVYKEYSQKPQVVVGKPESLAELVTIFDVLLPREETERAQKIADLLMYNLSLLMPKELRGFYSDFDI